MNQELKEKENFHEIERSKKLKDLGGKVFIFLWGEKMEISRKIEYSNLFSHYLIPSPLVLNNSEILTLET